MKVFCEKCDYFFYRRAHYEKCLHPENRILKEIKETYKRPVKFYKTYEFDPCQLNSKNDCKWFKPRISIIRKIKNVFKR